MANKREYLDPLKAAIEAMHQWGAVHRETVPVHEQFRGKTVWQGEVEVFDPTGNPRAKLCYAWSHREGPNDQGERFVTVLEILPVKDAQSAVKVAVGSEIRRPKQ